MAAKESDIESPAWNCLNLEHRRLPNSLIHHLLLMLQTASGMSFSRAFSHMRAVTAVRLLEGNARHTLDLDVPDALPELFGGRRDPKQVLINLLGNAVKFTPEGGRIGVTVSMAGGSMEIVISDNGIGIPKDRIADLCQPFKRIENVLSSRHQGSGMGLFNTKSPFD
jgi:signal transduction histidine kinase